MKQDSLCGIERWPQSEALGELVCPDINIWLKPFGLAADDNKLVAVLKHGQAVEVIGERENVRKSQTAPVWVKVRWIETTDSGSDQPVQKVKHGWLSKRFLLKGGAFHE